MNRFYYRVKPFLPRSLRIVLRRWMVQRKRERFRATWPINPATAKPPAGWPGWPGGKKFGFVLTHDVEGQDGLDKCRLLAAMDAGAGFRSSFNFIPEGEYEVPAALRDELVGQGFEVGVHDLCHDGHLYRSRQEFAASAQRINQYLKEWNACGFRSGFMLHNLEWLGDLQVAYDASTFDTDPFEPQPDGANTIFPFWVSRADGSEFLELPYTLPQDSTLFLYLQETSIDVWKQKLDWVVAHGGLVLVNVHPDYMSFSSSAGGAFRFPASWYRELLDYVREKYAGQYWHGTARQLAESAREARVKTAVPLTTTAAPYMKKASASKGGKIWIDLDNTPHVPFFIPIVAELKRRGYEVVLSARDAFQVCELADKKGVQYRKIGRHSGRNKIIKVLGLFYRALQLLPFARKERPQLAVSHGARSQVIIANLLGIPTVVLADYEFAKALPLMRPRWEIVPDVIASDALYVPAGNVKYYPGIKEDVYATPFTPDPAILQELGLREGETIITVRPPATEAHYHNPEAEVLFEHFMRRAMALPDTRVVLLPRNRRQEEFIRGQWPEWFKNNKTMVPGKAVDGINLIWFSDLVVSGGGTMNREAAALGVPVYSIFRGPTGAVDQYLQREGRLVMITSVAEVDHKITVARRKRNPAAALTVGQALTVIVDHLETILAASRRS